MTKFLLVIFLCLSISIPTAMSKSIYASQKKFNFNFYSSYLSTSLFPEIKTYLKSYKRYLNEDDAKNLSSEIYLIAVNHFNKNPIPLLFPPSIHIYKLESNRNIAFILQIELSLLDGEESFEDLPIKLKISKTFLIFFGKKKIGVKI